MTSSEVPPRPPSLHSQRTAPRRPWQTNLDKTGCSCQFLARMRANDRQAASDRHTLNNVPVTLRGDGRVLGSRNVRGGIEDLALRVKAQAAELGATLQMSTVLRETPITAPGTTSMLPSSDLCVPGEVGGPDFSPRHATAKLWFQFVGGAFRGPARKRGQSEMFGSIVCRVQTWAQA